jgi:hypothetical protein
VEGDGGGLYDDFDAAELDVDEDEDSDVSDSGVVGVFG